MKIDSKIQDYITRNNLELPKCNSDTVKLYLDYVLKDIDDETFKQLVYNIYKVTRGNIHEIGIIRPDSLAVAILHYASLFYKIYRKKHLLPAQEIYWLLGKHSSAGVTIANNRHKLKRFLEKNRFEVPPNIDAVNKREVKITDILITVNETYKIDRIHLEDKRLITLDKLDETSKETIINYFQDLICGRKIDYKIILIEDIDGNHSLRIE